MSEESYHLTDEFKRESEFLLHRIQKREELVSLLKIAHPAKIAQTRKLIARLDGIIAQTENLMQIHQKKHQLELEQAKQYAELEEQTDLMLPEHLAHLAKYNPEAHDKLVAELKSEDENSEVEPREF